MRILLIYNPQAGSGRAGRLLPQVASYLRGLGIDADLLLTEYNGHAVELVAGARLEDYEAVVASGGDGTLFEVVNGYYQNQSLCKPPIGLIPNGTGNAFMKELGLRKSDWRRAIDIISEKYCRPVDVGQFVSGQETWYFMNIVGLGLVSEIATAALPLKWMGNAAYTVATLLKLFSLTSVATKIVLDGEERSLDTVFVEVANTTYTGSTFLIAPRAKIDDGLLDVILLKPISRMRLLKLFRSIYDGSHVNYPEIEYRQAREIRIVEDPPGRLAPDGEILAWSPVEIRCLHRDLEFLWDADWKP